MCPCCFFSSGLIHKCHTHTGSSSSSTCCDTDLERSSCCRPEESCHQIHRMLQKQREVTGTEMPKHQKNVGEGVNFYICLHLQSAGWAVGPSDSQRGELPPVKGSHDVFILRLLTRWGQIRRGCRRTSKPLAVFNFTRPNAEKSLFTCVFHA